MRALLQNTRVRARAQEEAGNGPSTEAFVRTCAALAGPNNARVLVSFELRSEVVKQQFLCAAQQSFAKARG